MVRILLTINSVNMLHENDKEVEYSYDEAVELAGHGHYNRLLLVACSLIGGAVGLDMFGFAVVVAKSSCDLQLNIGHIGVLASMPFVGLLFACGWGYYADTRGRRHALLLSCSVGSVLAMLGSLSPNWQTLLVTKLVGCSFSSAAFSIAMAYLGECTGNKRRSRYIFMMNSFNNISEAVIYTLAFAVQPLSFNIPIPWLGITYRPWRLLTLLLALPLGIGAIVLCFLHESPKFLANRGKYDKALEVLRKIFEINGGKKDEYQVKVLSKNPDIQNDQSLWESIKHQTVPIFKPPLLWRTLQLCYLMVIVCATNNVVVMWYPTIVTSFFASLSNGSGVGVVDDRSFCDRFVGNLTPTHSDVGDSVCNDTVAIEIIYTGIATGLFFGIFNLCISKLAEWRRGVLFVTLLIPGLCEAAFNITGDPIISLVLFTVVQGTCIGIGIVASYCVDLYPTSYRGVIISLTMMAARLGSFIGINIVGLVVTSSCGLTFYCFAVFVLSGAAVTLLLPPDKKKTKT